MIYYIIKTVLKDNYTCVQLHNIALLYVITNNINGLNCQNL